MVIQSQDNVKGIVRQFITENYLASSGQSGFQDDDSFMGKGIIDSTGVLELLEFVEEKFRITIEDEEVVPDNLDSLNRLTFFIERKLEHAGQ